MRISMKRFVAASLLAALTLVATTSPRLAAGADRTVATEASASARTLQSPAAAQELVGTGIVAKLACMACAGTFLAATGTGSIAALIIVVGANPELASACVIGCIAAFS